MYLNVTILVLTAVNLILRLRDPIGAILPVGLIISLIVGTLTSVSGWYGAELSYRIKLAW